MSGSSSKSAASTDDSNSVLAEWATSLVQHLQTQRSSAPISVVLPRLLGPAVERHLRSIIESAVKIQRRAKRSTLSVEDVNFALQLANEECVFGFSSSKSTQVTRWDGEEDLQWSAEQPILLTETCQASLPPAPLAPSYTNHWLAVEGIQPDIAQNPPKKRVAVNMDSQSSSSCDKDGGGDSSHQMVSHILSHEMQILFGKVTEAMRSGVEAQQKATFSSLATQSGLQELMPYFSQFIQSQVVENLKNLPLLRTMMEMLRCLLNNPHVHLELYLHQLVPAVLTCIVGKKLCQDPYTEDHWSLRDTAAGILATICLRFGSVYSGLQPRTTKALFEALGNDKPITTRYGAIVAITKLGALCVELLIFPLLSDIESTIESDLQQATSTQSSRTSSSSNGQHTNKKNTNKKGSKKGRESSSSSPNLKNDLLTSMNALMCRGALLNALATMLASLDVGNRSKSLTSHAKSKGEAVSEPPPQKRQKSKKNATISLLKNDGNGMSTPCPGRKHNLAKRIASNKLKENKDTNSSTALSSSSESTGNTTTASNGGAATVKTLPIAQSTVGVPSLAYGDALTPIYIRSLSKNSASPCLLFI